MKVEWHIEDLGKVIKFFVQGYQIPRDEELVQSEWWLDPKKGEVIIKLSTIKQKKRS